MQRASTADALFAGRLTPARARQFVRRSGARFLLAACPHHVDLERWLGSLIVAHHRFGCADVYQLRTPAKPTGPFANPSPIGA